MKAEYKWMWALMICWWLLNGCAPAVGPAEILPISQTATVTGVYSVAIGAEPLGHVLENAQGLRVVIWPGARIEGGQLWNFACVMRCETNWFQDVARYVTGPGRATSGITMSRFVAQLKAEGFKEIVPAALGAGESVSAFAGQLSGIITGFMVVPVAPGMMDEPMGKVIQN